MSSTRQSPSSGKRRRLSPTEEDRLDSIIADFLDGAARDPGDASASSVLRIFAENPDLADELHEFFADHGAIDRATRPLREEDQPDALAKLSAAPRRLGDYEIVRELARGGMGIVFEARDPKLDRRVALKTLLGGRLASPDLIERFQREARACARLHHPNIVPIYQVETDGDRPFYVMELLGGGNLCDRETPLPESRADFIALAKRIELVARAVHFAHERGVLHRDLKPSNILLDAAGTPHVSDFGLAAFLDGDSDSGLTRTGDALGSPSYMAPEQAEGRRHDVSVRSDTYSLGAVLYELLAGAPAFSGKTTLETLRSVVEDAPASPIERNPAVPRDLATICLVCLRKNPDARYDTADALADELARFARGDPILAREPSRLERFRDWTRRNLVAILVVAVLASITITALSFALLWRHQRNVAMEHDRRAILGQASYARTSTAPGRSLVTLRNLADAARIRAGLDLRNEAIAGLALVDCEPVVVRENWRGEARRFAFDSRDELFAAGHANGTVELRTIATGELRGTLRAPESAPWTLLFSPNGRHNCGPLNTPRPLPRK